MSLPQAAVTLIGHSKNMRRQLPHLVFAVQIDCSAFIQARYLLVGIYCCEDRTNVCLEGMQKNKEVRGRKKGIKKMEEDRLSIKGDRIHMMVWKFLQQNLELLHLAKHNELLCEQYNRLKVQ